MSYSRSLNRSLLLLFTLITSPLLQAHSKWIRVSTAHFEMFTDGRENQALRALQTFEQVRYFFLHGTTHPEQFTAVTRIVAFASEAEYSPYRMNAGAIAFYQPSPQRDYIVMQDLDTEHHAVAIHEYTHLVLNTLKLSPPLWLNEGLAELYSSLEPNGKKAMVGRPLAGRSVTLVNQPWMDWNTLFQVDRESPYYNQPDKMQIFYAQSWVTAHMLALSPEYRPKFLPFLMAVSNGTSTAQAFSTVYGKSVAQVAADVQKYAHQSRVQVSIFDVTLSKSELETTIEDLPDFDRDLALAELLSSRPERAAEARTRLLALEQKHAESVPLQVALAYLSWQQNDQEEARQHFHRALQQGMNQPKALFDYAQLLQGTGTPDLTADLLRRVLAAQPNNFDARWLLAITAGSANRYGEVLSVLATAHDVPADRAFDVFSLLATARANLKDYAGARTDINRAQAYAKTDTQHEQLKNFSAFLDAPKALPAPDAAAVSESTSAVPAAVAPTTPAPHRRVDVILAADMNLPRVRGTAKSFDCENDKFRIHMEIEGHEMVFALPKDPKDILVRNAGTRTVEFTCGALEPQELTVIYKPSEEKHIDGVVAELVY